jgi:hypothetical protein
MVKRNIELPTEFEGMETESEMPIWWAPLYSPEEEEIIMEEWEDSYL